MEPFQYFIIAFFLFASGMVFLQYRQKKISLTALFLWESIWVVALLFGLFAGRVSFLSRVLGIGRIVDVGIYLSIAFLFYLVFRLYLKIESLEREITVLVRSLAITRAKKASSLRKKP